MLTYFQQIRHYYTIIIYVHYRHAVSSGPAGMDIAHAEIKNIFVNGIGSKHKLISKVVTVHAYFSGN